uniref:Uncharacterized protein n=1 Tax=Arundo donax TaxID=35708 RepID=A0A0A9D6U0_ARUDO
MPFKLRYLWTLHKYIHSTLISKAWRFCHLERKYLPWISCCIENLDIKYHKSDHPEHSLSKVDNHRNGNIHPCRLLCDILC